MNSKNKGKRGELEVAKLLKSLGYEGARRTAQYCGNTGEASDVVGADGLHLEVKRAENLRMMDWIQQAERDARPEELPVVVFRQSKEPWRVVLNAERFFAIYKEYIHDKP